MTICYGCSLTCCPPLDVFAPVAAITTVGISAAPAELYTPSCITVILATGTDFDVYITYGDGADGTHSYQDTSQMSCFSHQYGAAGRYVVAVSVVNQ